MNVLESFSLAQKVALVTGGAGRYGRQIVEAVAEAGAKTFMASRKLKKLEAQAETFRRAGLDVTALQYDQGNEDSMKALLETLIKRAGRVDILVNNAKLNAMEDWSSPTEDFERSMKVNATGLFVMTRLFGEHMAERGSGSIINIGSIQGMVGPDYALYEGLGWGMDPDYWFHKGGMLNLTRYVASKLGPRGVRVNTISPGGLYNNQDERFLNRYNDRTFLSRMANDTDLKGAIVFLASEASAYVTGANFIVDGGYTAK